jgi:phosphatidylserine/phosphatidylglycerophosphate/cardiolipin synthase-like enzyme
MINAKRYLLIALLALGCQTTPNQKPGDGLPDNQAPTMIVKFSPSGGAEQQIVESINSANTSIKVQAYSFTSVPIGQALIAAHKRNVSVVLVLDRENLGNKSSMMRACVEAGIPVYLDAKHAIAHNKVMIIDETVVLTGSFNFTSAAEHHNAENSLYISNVRLASDYSKNWEVHKNHSNLFQP